MNTDQLLSILIRELETTSLLKQQCALTTPRFRIIPESGEKKLVFTSHEFADQNQILFYLGQVPVSMSCAYEGGQPYVFHFDVSSYCSVWLTFLFHPEQAAIELKAKENASDQRVSTALASSTLAQNLLQHLLEITRPFAANQERNKLAVDQALAILQRWQ